MGDHLSINTEGKFEEVPAPPDPLLLKIQSYILATYEPVSNPADADVMMSTNEIYDAVSNFYQNELLFSKDQLATWLHEKGFSFIDAGKMRFEWLLKSVP